VAVNHYIGVNVFFQGGREFGQRGFRRLAQNRFACFKQDAGFKSNLDAFTDAFNCGIATKFGFQFGSLFIHFMTYERTDCTTDSSTSNGANSRITK